MHVLGCETVNVGLLDTLTRVLEDLAGPHCLWRCHHQELQHRHSFGRADQILRRCQAHDGHDAHEVALPHTEQDVGAHRGGGVK